MRRLNNICNITTLRLMCFLTLLLVLNACKEEPFSFQESQRQVLMMDVIRQDTSLSIAVQALEKAKMAGTLNTYGPFTFFAPDNSAFRKYFKNQGKSGLNDYTEEEVKTLMIYHVLPARLKASEFIQGPQTYATGRGDYITIDISKGYKSTALVNGKATAYQTDIEYSNGYLHKMDGVLDPPTLTIGQFMLQNPDKYSIMIGGLQRAKLMDTLVNLVNANNERIRLTLFAETNDVLKAAGITSFDNVPLAELKKQMQYHIIKGTNFSSSYTFLTQAHPAIGLVERWDNTILTLNNDEWIYFNLAGAKLMNNETVNFTASDIIMKNGVLHNVDNRLVFHPGIKRTQIYHQFSTAFNQPYGIPGFTPNSPPVPLVMSGNWRTLSENPTPVPSRGNPTITLVAFMDNVGDSVITLVKNVKKGKYSFEVNVKSGGRPTIQLMHGDDNIGVPVNYGSQNGKPGSYEQRLPIGTYEFKTSGDKRIKLRNTTAGTLVVDCLVLTPVYN